MEFRTIQDIESVMEILGITREEFSRELGVSRVTLHNWIKEKTAINDSSTRLFYEYAFKKGIRLNKIKEQLYREDEIKNGEVLLFHGAKTFINGRISLSCNKKINDFGNGFYCGESLEQSAMFVAAYPDSSLYMLTFKGDGLNVCSFEVNRDWMLTVTYFRGRLKEYENTEIVKMLISDLKDIDYIIAPIADNRMFEIIDSFIDGEITDVQCQHCLSATNLGKQYVFVSQRAVDRLSILERCFLAEAEKEYYLFSRQESFKMNLDKLKLARKQYRNQGDYIEDILL